MAIVTLNKKETTKEEPKVVTTQKEPSVTTTITATESPFRKADGGVNDEAVNAFNQNYGDPLARAYEIDPVSGRFVGDVGTLLGFDPVKYKAEQEAKARLAQFKQKEAGWRDGLGVILDAVTAGIGGNVWERKPDSKAAEARAENEQANSIINGIGKAVNDAKKGQELAYNKARQEALNKYISDFGRKISQKRTQGGGIIQTTQGGGKTTTGFRQEQEHQGDSDGRGNGGKNKKVKMKVAVQDPITGERTRYITITVPEQEARAYRSLAQNELQQKFSDEKYVGNGITNPNDENYKEIKDKRYLNMRENLKNAGVYNPDADVFSRWNEDNERFYNYPITWKTEALDTELQRLWRLSDEYNALPDNQKKDLIFDYEGNKKTADPWLNPWLNNSNVVQAPWLNN